MYQGYLIYVEYNWKRYSFSAKYFKKITFSKYLFQYIFLAWVIDDKSATFCLSKKLEHWNVLNWEVGLLKGLCSFVQLQLQYMPSVVGPATFSHELLRWCGVAWRRSAFGSSEVLMNQWPSVHQQWWCCSPRLVNIPWTFGQAVLMILSRLQLSLNHIFSFNSILQWNVWM